MTKQALQKELKEKVKPGVKPSQLKRSKSADDIPQPQSNPPETELEKLKKETQTKSTTISLLRKKNDELEQQLKSNPPTQLLTDQLKEKQKEVESLRSKLENANAKLTERTEELDNSLQARYEALKDFDQLYNL
jgi:SMC interacting uncharacterized protein involved in chromosome segregation